MGQLYHHKATYFYFISGEKEEQEEMRKKRMVAVLLSAVMAVGLFGSIPATQVSAAQNVVKKVEVKNVDETLVLKKGSKFTLKTVVTVSGTASKKVTYQTNNKKVVSVNKKGTVKALKKGTAKITVKSVKNSTKKCVFRVVVGTPVQKVKVEKNVTVKVGQSRKINVAVTPKKASVKTVSYKSSNKAVAKVTSKGKVTGVAAGTAKITVSAKDGSKKRATCKVTVLKGTGYVTLEERYADEEKRLNIPVNDAGTTWGFDKGNGNLIPLKLKVGETTVVEYLGTLGHRGIHQYEWTLEDQVSNVIDPNSGYVDVKQIGNKFFITPLKEGMYEIHVLENTIPESSGFNRNYYCYFQTENPYKYSQQPQIGGKYYKKYHHLDSPVYTVKSQYQDGSFAFACEESTTGNIVRMHSYELEPVSMWE